jgi:hypothetical protein
MATSVNANIGSGHDGKLLADILCEETEVVLGRPTQARRVRVVKWCTLLEETTTWRGVVGEGPQLCCCTEQGIVE